MSDQTILIHNGTIIDGSGQQPYCGNVLIQNRKIESILEPGKPLPDADQTVDASGCIVAPGFIDMHSHADWNLPRTDHPSLLKCYLEQGVTTVIGGNCGFSPAPINDSALQVIGRNLSSLLTDRPLSYDWRSMEDFFDRVQNARPVLNLAELAGHATIRSAVAGHSTKPLTAREMDRCRGSLREALEQGACGISFGLGYEPGMYAPADELEAFCEIAGKAGKTATVHVKALSKISPTYPVTYLKPHNLRAIREMLEVAKKTDVALQLSHFIFVGRNSWATADKALSLVENARRNNVNVMIDAFPYTCGNTTINVLFPYWFLKQLPSGYDSRFARARLRAELEIGFRLVGFIYKDFQVMDIAIQEWEHLNGLNLVEIAREWRISPFETLLTISRKTEGNALMLFHTYSGEEGNEQVLERVLASEFCLFETDAIVRSGGFPNPASLGTFPKILGTYARDKKLFDLEAAVHRMTAAAADRFGLHSRGRLERNKAADIVVFDPEAIGETAASGKTPAGKPTGIEHVFLNGEHVVREGTYIEGRRAGSILTS